MASITPKLELNGNDYSDIIKEVGMSVSYQKREGKNGGMMKDGSMTVDILAWKAVITVTTKGTTPARMMELLEELIDDYVEVTFIDTRSNLERTADFIPSVVETPIAYFKDGEIGFYNSTKVTLTER